MKLMQQETTFSPIAIVLETEREACQMWDIVSAYEGNGSSEGAYALAVKISNFFSNEAKL